MKLTYYQKEYLKKNIEKKDINGLCKELQIPESVALKYLNKIWGPEKLKKRMVLENPKDTQKLLNIPKNHVILLFILGLLLYLSALNNDFVSDDIAGIKNNLQLGTFEYLFSSWQLIINTLPLHFITVIFGKDPFYYRAFNVLVHIINAVLVYLIARKKFNESVSLISSLLFICHPIFIESVTWLSGYSYSLSTLMFLTSLYFYFFSFDNVKYYYISLLFFIFTLLSSQKTGLLFLSFFLYNFLFKNTISNYLKLIPHVVFSFVQLYHLYSVSYADRLNVLVTQHYLTTEKISYFVSVPLSIVNYLGLIIFPYNLTLYHTSYSFGISISQILFGLFMIVLIYIFFKNKIVFYFLSLFLISLIPYLYNNQIAWIVAERYIYLGSIFILLIISYVLDLIYKKYSNHSFLFKAIFILVLLLLSVRTLTRNSDWKNEDTLWISSVKASPNSHNAHNNMGDVYSRRGQYDEAIKSFETAIKIKPDYADAYHNIAFTYERKNDFDNAIKHYELATKVNPNLWQSYYRLGLIYFTQKKDIKTAETYFLETLKINNSVDIYYILAEFYKEIRNYSESIKYYERVLTIDPNNNDVRAEVAKLKLLD